MLNTKYFTKKTASEYLSIKLGIPIFEKTLSKFITCGNGPIYHKFGNRVVYEEKSLDSWILSRLSKEYKSFSKIVE